jgi:hypothetical protein
MINPFSALTSKVFLGTTIAALTFGAIQTVRIEGFWFIKGYEQRLAAANSALDAVNAASKTARDKQIQINLERKGKSDDLAKQGDDSFALAARAAGPATTRYIDRWRVRNVCEGLTKRRDLAAQGNDAVVPEEMPAGAVLVSEGDVQACTGATAYAIEAHNHAMSKIEAGIAE